MFGEHEVTILGCQSGSDLGVARLMKRDPRQSKLFRPLLPKPHDLLKFAVEAHGGLSRWNQLNFVKADVSITETI